MCGGSKGQSTSKQNTNSSNSYTPAGLQELQQIWQQANQASQIPYVPYGGQLVAGFTPEQQVAQQNINMSPGMAQPYINASAGLFGQSAQNPNTNGLVQSFYNPMAQNVMANLNEVFGQQMAQTSGQLQQAAGGVGADRIAVGQDELARQQGLAAGQTMSGLYGQALQAAQGQQGLEQAAAFGFGQLGPAAEQALLSGANAQLGIGTLGQQTEQNLLNANYQQFLRQQGYPFQTAGFLGSVGLPAATSMGGTGTGQMQGTSVYTPPQPNPISQGLGIGIGLMGMMQKGGRIKRDAGGVIPFNPSNESEFNAQGYVPQMQMQGGSPYNPMAMAPQMMGAYGGGQGNSMVGGNPMTGTGNSTLNSPFAQAKQYQDMYKQGQQAKSGFHDLVDKATRNGWLSDDEAGDLGALGASGWDTTTVAGGDDTAARGGRFAWGGSPGNRSAYLPNGGGIGDLQTVQVGPKDKTFYAGQNGQFFENPMQALSPAEQAVFKQQSQSNNSNSNSNSSPQSNMPAPFVPSQSSVDIGNITGGLGSPWNMGGMMPFIPGGGGGNQSTFDPTAGGTLSTNPSWLSNGMGAGHSGLPFATLAYGGRLRGYDDGGDVTDYPHHDDDLAPLPQMPDGLPPLRFGDDSMPARGLVMSPPPLTRRGAYGDTGLSERPVGASGALHLGRSSGLVMSPQSQGDRPGLMMGRPPSAATNDMDWPSGGATRDFSPARPYNPPPVRGSLPPRGLSGMDSSGMDSNGPLPPDRVITDLKPPSEPLGTKGEGPFSNQPQPVYSSEGRAAPQVHHAAPSQVHHVADADLEHAYLMAQISGKSPFAFGGGIRGYDDGGDVQDTDPLTVDEKGNPIDPYARVNQILKNEGLSAPGAAALTSRANVESGMNPKAVGDDGTSFGMSQLHRGQDEDRLTPFLRWAKQNDLVPTNRDVQTAYMAQEGKTTEQGPWQQMVNAKTPEQGVAGAMAFERPKGWSSDNPQGGLGYRRTLAGANDILAGVDPSGLGAVGSDAGDGGISGGRYPQTDSEMAQNLRQMRENAAPIRTPWGVTLTPGRQALMEFGFGMAASPSPFFGNAVGAGGLAAMSEMNQARQLQAQLGNMGFNQAMALQRLGVSQDELRLRQQEMNRNRYEYQNTPAGQAKIDKWGEEPTKITPWDQIGKQTTGTSEPSNSGSDTSQPAETEQTMFNPKGELAIDTSRIKLDPQIPNIAFMNSNASASAAQKERDASDTMVTGAEQQKAVLANMIHDSTSLQAEGKMGVGAEQFMGIAKTVNGFARLFGMQEPISQTDEGNPEAIRKGTMQLLLAQANTAFGKQREAGFFLNQMRSLLPNIETSPNAFRQVTANLLTAADYVSAFNQWKSSVTDKGYVPGNLEGQFLKAYPHSFWLNREHMYEKAQDYMVKAAQQGKDYSFVGKLLQDQGIDPSSLGFTLGPYQGK